MKTYENHEFNAEMAKPAPAGLVDPMVVYRQVLEEFPDTTVDDYGPMKIADIERRLRVEEREEARPVEEVPPPVADPDLKNRKI